MATLPPQTVLGNIFRWMAEVFFYVAPATKLSLYYIFHYIGNLSGDIPFVGEYLQSRFYAVRDLCGEISFKFWDVAHRIDLWWAEIGNIWDNLSSVVNYAWGELTDKATQAHTWAIWAMDWASQAWNRASAIAGVIGTTFAEIVAFIKEHAEIIYQTVNEYITNVYQTFVENIYNTYETIKNYITNVYETVQEYITNVYETVQNYYNTYVTEIIGVAEEWVMDFVAAALAPFAAPINLVNLWFDSIQDFFNDPLGWLLDRFGDWFFGPEA